MMGAAPPSAPQRSSRAPWLAWLAAAALGCVAGASWSSLSCSSGGGGGGAPQRLQPPRLTGAGAGLHTAAGQHTPFSLPKEERLFAYESARLEVPTLVSRLRRLLTVQLALAALLNDVPGDFVETGVFTGGTSILMAKALERHDSAWAPGGGDSGGGGGSGGGRRLWSADSFQGTPAPVEQDQGSDGRMRTGFKGEYASGLDVFRGNLEKWGVARHLAADRLQILQGWFNETLPEAPIAAISFLRLDGDLYVSTMDALQALYDRVSPGGLIYIDDYGSYTGCQRAVHEFRESRGIASPLNVQSVPEQVLFVPPGAETVWAAAWWVKEAHEHQGKQQGQQQRPPSTAPA